MEANTRTAQFWWFQLIFWAVAGTALFLSGATQMPIVQALVRNFFLLVSGFLSSFFLAMLIDELRWMSILRLRLSSYALSYVIALFCVVVINAITFTLQGVEISDITFGQWFSGTFNMALVYAFWSELFIQHVYMVAKPATDRSKPDKLIVEHRGTMVPVPIEEIDAITAAGDYVEVHTANRTYLDRQTLRSMHEALGEEDFVQIHRSRLVNRGHVTSVTPIGKGCYQLHLRNGSSVTSSRGYREVVQQHFLVGIA